MYRTINYAFVGVCPDIDFQYKLESGTILVYEDLNDALPYLYEKHFGIPYSELSWYLEPGAKEWVKELEDKWMHNELDLSEVYNDEEFIASLSEENTHLSESTIEDMKDELEDAIEEELDCLSVSELKELYDEDDVIRYTIEDDNGNVIAGGFVIVPEPDDEEDDE